MPLSVAKQPINTLLSADGKLHPTANRSKIFPYHPMKNSFDRSLKSFWRNLFYQFQYMRNPPWDTGVTPPELVQFVAANKPGRALDLGCGTGTNAVYLANHGWQTIGVDFVARAVRTARQKAQQAGVEVNFLVGDVVNPKGISGPFQLILDIGCLHSLSTPDKRRYIDNITRLLDSRGTFLLYGFICSEDETSPGLCPADLERLEARLELGDRQLGTDRGRTSAWLSYHRPVDTSPIQ